MGALISLIIRLLSFQPAGQRVPDAPRPQTTDKEGRLLSFHEVSLLFIQLHARRRRKGNTSRLAYAPLCPPEAVCLIFEYAGIEVLEWSSSNFETHTVAQDADERYLFLKLPIPREMPQGFTGAGRLLPLFLPSSIKVFTSTHDQGWSSEPENRGMRNSHTWVELGLEMSSSLEPRHKTVGPRNMVARNLHAVGFYEEQQACFDINSEMVAELRRLLIDAANSPDQEGLKLRLVLYLRSLYPAWVCFCRHAAIEVSYSLVGFEGLLSAVANVSRLEERGERVTVDTPLLHQAR